MSETALVELSAAVLAAIVNHWPTEDLDAAPNLRALPERNYVNIGPPPYDCEQVVVWVERSFGTESSPAREAIVPLTTGAGYLRTMVCTVEILRCVETVDENAGEPTIPEASTMSAESFTTLTDADTVLDLLVAAHRRNELAGCGDIAFENWRAISAQGGLEGGGTKLRINLF